jgi:uncharacterized protein YbcV (DUF1398 family)
MQDLTRAVLEDCTFGSDNERLTFPQVVGNLISAGVERYHADLQRSEKTYFLPCGESLVIKTHAITETPAPTFHAEGVEAAVRAIQAGKIKYIEFCERIMRAGCVSYIVSLAGRRAVYYGRSGETYVEPFPA